MRVNFDARMKNNTGIGLYIRSLMEHISKDNNEVDFLVNEKIKLFSLKEQLYLNKMSNRNSILHCPHFNAPVVKNGKLVITIHDLAFNRYEEEFSNKAAKIYYNFVMNRNMKNADHIITISESSKKDIVDFYGISEERITVIKHGAPYVDTNYNLNLKEIVYKKFNITKPFIFFVGINRPRKNLKNLVLAYRELIKKSDVDVQLVIAGKKDSRYYDMEKDIKAFNLEDNIILTDFVNDDELKCLYSNCEAFIFPSIYEGFGFPVLEAMLFKVPVICSNTSSLPEVVGDAGIYFDPYDVNDMAQKIYDVLKDNNLKSMLVDKGNKQVQKFSWEESSMKHLEVYESVWKGKK